MSDLVNAFVALIRGARIFTCTDCGTKTVHRHEYSTIIGGGQQVIAMRCVRCNTVTEFEYPPKSIQQETQP